MGETMNKRLTFEKKSTFVSNILLLKETKKYY